MRLSRIHIKNFRCFKDQEILFDSYNTLVGANGSGKSTVLMALNVFFRNTAAPSDVINLTEEDFFNKNTQEPIEIRCTFSDLSDEAAEDFRAYVRQKELTITAKANFNKPTSSAEVVQRGVRRVMSEFIPYFEANDEGAMARKLKDIYEGIRSSVTDLPDERIKQNMYDALREYEESHPELCTDTESDNQFYGWSKGTNLLRKYVQWIYVPAVKDPSEEQDEQKNSALGALLQRTIRAEIDFSDAIEEMRLRANEEYKDLINRHNSVLEGVQSSLQNQLKSWAHPAAKVNLQWHFDDQKSISINKPFARAKVGDGDFLGEIVRSGHGMQRSFVVALLQVLANLEESDSPTLLLGFEEPELYQHPPQAKHLAALLEELTGKGTQAIVTTHSPYFVSSKGFENIRLVRQGGSQGNNVSQYTYRDLSEALAVALGEPVRHPSATMAAVEQVMLPSQTELYFCSIPILVEGPEDVAFLTTYMQLNGMWADFRRLGCHFITCGGKSPMSRPLAIAIGLGMSPFVVFDADSDNKKNAKQNRKENSVILNLLGSQEDPLPAITIFARNFVMWRSKILDEVKLTMGAELWDEACNEVRDTFDLHGVQAKHPTLVSATVEKILESGTDLEILSATTRAIIEFASNAKNTSNDDAVERV
ncbi:MAG: AAA family ATPase [Pseudomonadota bacterium]